MKSGIATEVVAVDMRPAASLASMVSVRTAPSGGNSAVNMVDVPFHNNVELAPSFISATTYDTAPLAFAGGRHEITDASVLVSKTANDDDPTAGDTGCRTSADEDDSGVAVIGGACAEIDAAPTGAAPPAPPFAATPPMGGALPPDPTTIKLELSTTAYVDDTMI